MIATLRVLVADDELLARRRLVRLLQSIPGTTLVAACSSGHEVLATIARTPVDVILLDIQMPGLSGLDALALMPAQRPFVIFCTAHPTYAIDAFDGGAIDYVLKPIEVTRLAKALQRARDGAREGVHPLPTPGIFTGRETPLSAASDTLAIRTRLGITLIDPRTISHAILAGPLVSIVTSEGQHLSELSLNALQDRLPVGLLVRVHRRALVNLAQVVRFEHVASGGYIAITMRGQAIEVSRQAARMLRRRLGLTRKTPGSLTADTSSSKRRN